MNQHATDKLLAAMDGVDTKLDVKHFADEPRFMAHEALLRDHEGRLPSSPRKRSRA